MASHRHLIFPGHKPLFRLINLLSQLTPSQLRTAANLKEKIASLEKELAAIVGASAPAAKTPTEKPEKKKRKTSAAGRAKIAAAQKKRWAKVKADKKA
jgi:hypothetical protein